MRNRNTKQAAADDAEPQATLKYRPDVDGLRAIAVLVVIGYHAFPQVFPGGFVGVDVFFVISGFLISGIILNDLRLDKFSFSRFYARRVRRIFPSLIFVLAVSFVLGWWLLLPAEFVSLGENIVGAAAFVSNFVLFKEAGYFDIAAVYKPLLHLWSLGIEEQFYIVWPLMLLAVFKRGQVLFWCIVALSAISFALNVATVRQNLTAAFYLPHTRAWELLLGGLLACIKMNRVPPWLGEAHARADLMLWGAVAARLGHEVESVVENARACLGIALIGCSVIFVQPHLAFPGWRALLPTFGALFLVWAEKSWFNQNVLSNRAVVGVGLISYPLYLWHWPLLSFARIAQTGQLSVFMSFLCIAASFILAWLTYVFVEKPFRFGRPDRLKLASLGVSMAMVGCLGLATVKQGGFEIRIPEPMRDNYRELTGPDMNFDFNKMRAGTCFLLDRNDKSNFKDSCVESEVRPLVFIWGDSTSAAIYPGLHRAQQTHDFGIGQFSVGGCPPFLNYVTNSAPFCEDNNNFALSVISRYQPNVVLLHSAWPLYSVTLDELRVTISTLRKAGDYKIIVLGPPVGWIKPLPQLILKNFANSNSLGPERTNSYLRENWRETDQVLRKKVDAWGAGYISVWDAMCNMDGCLMRVGPRGSDVTAFDDVHLTIAGSGYLADAILPQLIDVGPRNAPAR